MMLIHSFKKIMTGPESYKIGYFHNGEFQKYVNEDKPLYVDFKKKNEVEVVPYSPPPKPPKPPPPPEPTVEEKRSTVLKMAERKQHEALAAGFEFGGKSYPSSLEEREFMETGARLAKAALDKSADVTIKTVTLDDKVVELSAVDAVKLREVYDAHWLVIRDQYISEIQQAKLAEESQLDHYISNKAFE